MTGTIFNIMRFALNDGPGIRTTVFLKGCPLVCAWCHNPEGLRVGHEVAYRQERCALCGACVDACPEHALSGTAAGIERDADLCIACGTCAETCVNGAREQMGREITVEDLVADLLKDRVFFDESGGGVTFSGGEPLLQFDFLAAALTACRAAGLRTAVETTGFAPAERVLALASLTDLFLYDVKFVDEERHRRFTGVSNTRILENLRLLSEAGAPLIVRFPLVPGVNDDDENVGAIASLTADLGTIPAIHVLPFHAAAAGKYRALNMAYAMEGKRSPDQDQLRRVTAIITAHGVTVHMGG
jgi:pyruvate formate lyase activating enzyme